MNYRQRNYNSERPEAGKELGILEGTKKSTGLEVEYYEKEAESLLSPLGSLDFTLSTVGSYTSSKQGNDTQFTKNYLSCHVQNGLYRVKHGIGEAGATPKASSTLGSALCKTADKNTSSLHQLLGGKKLSIC